MTWTLLHDTCAHLDANGILERCKSNPREALEVDDHGSTPLHLLAWSNPDPKLVQVLISCCPAAITNKDVLGNTALHIAASYPKTSVGLLQTLVDACPTLPGIPNKEGLMPLHTCCRFCPQNERVIGYFIQAYPSALRSRIKMGDVAPRCRRQPLKERKEGDHFVGPEGSNFDEARFQSLSHQVRDGAYPLHMAVQNRATRPVVEMFVKEAADVLLQGNKFHETPLHLALKFGAEDAVVELLIEHGAGAIHMRDKQKNLPIHVAAKHGCAVGVAKALLQHNLSSVQEKNGDKKTALDLAVECGKCTEDVIRLFDIACDNSEEPAEE